MHKVIHSEFELDLSNLKLDIVEENPYFSDKYFTKYTYPFKLLLTESVTDFFETILDHNADNIVTSYDVIYVKNNIMEDAKLIIEEILNDEISLSLQYGFDEFPNFNKKLSELQLQKLTFSNPENIYTHAKSILNSSYPAVNYNFPAIHVDNIDEDQFHAFEKVINNYQNDAFIINEVINDVIYNRNIIQPVPYWMYILKRGFEMSGYELKGDVLNIAILKKMMVFSNQKYFKVNDIDSIDLSLMGDEAVNIDGSGNYYKEIAIPHKGKWKLSGSIFIYGRWKQESYVVIMYRGNVLVYETHYTKKHHSGYLYFHEFQNLVFETVNDTNPDVLKIYSIMWWQDGMILSGIGEPIVLYDNNGAPIPKIMMKNEIDLNAAVPNITFGEFVTITRNLFNLDLTTRNKEIWMNYINKQINYNDAIDLTNYQVKNPARKLNIEDSFELKFSNVDHETYKYSSLFIDKTSERLDSYTINDNTTTIEIRMLPLPLANRNAGNAFLETAHDFEGSQDIVFAVIYDGLQSGINKTLTPISILIPKIYEDYYREWLRFRINSILYQWNFNCWAEDISELKANSKIFAYNNILMVKSINKSELKEDLFNVEIESYRLL